MAVYTNAFFVDGLASAIPPMLVYVTGSGGSDSGEYAPFSFARSVSTSATQRIGSAVLKENQKIKIFETTDLGVGVRVGNVTIFENGDGADVSGSIKTFDGFRTGRNIKTFGQFGGSYNVRPMIRISPEGFFEKNSGEKINHFASFNSFGMGLHYKIVGEDHKLIPFNDFSKLIAKDLMGRKSVFAYPFVHNDKETLKQFVDPSHPGNDGAIDVFEVRYSLANLSPADISLYGCKGSLQSGGIESSKKGSTIIDSKYEIKSRLNATFLDSQELEFGTFSFPQIGVTGSSGFKFPLPGFIDDSMYISSPFDDAVDYLKGSYKFATLPASMGNFLSSSRNSISEIGTRFKSTTCGLVYGESNSFGTDSIAFGGLKK
jgi:hypothetical protein|tara:strand:+ start:54545 stop:55666 length:1122 start_codon:yes stop_codon:yes gene_type:complete